MTGQLYRAETPVLPTALAQALLFGTGGLLVSFYLYDLILEWGQTGYPFWVSLVESGLLFGLGGTILAIAGRLSARSRNRIYLSKTAKGCVVGCVAAMGGALLLYVLRAIRGEGAPMVYTITSIGAFAGTLVGYYQARNAQVRRELRSITENLEEGIYRSTPEEGIVFANQAFAEMFGYESPEALLEVDPATLYVHPERRKDLRETIRVDGGFEAEEAQLQRKDGSRFTGLLSGTAVRAEDGTVKYYDGVLADITERKEKERTRRVLAAAIEQVSESIVLTNARPLEDGGPQLQYANPAFEEMTGYEVEEAMGAPPDLLMGPETEPEVRDDFIDHVEAGRPWQGEMTTHRKDGSTFIAEWNVAPVVDQEGQLAHWVSLQRDVTEERRREEQLRRQKQLLEQAQRLAGAWEADLQTGEQTWSEEVYRIFEIEPGTSVSVEEANDFFPPEARSEIRAAFRRCVEEGKPYDLELPIQTATRTRRWVRTVGAPSEIKDGEVLKMAGAIQDITERKETETALRKAKEEAEEVSRLKSSMLANMSHEIRTPLTSIIGFAGAIEEQVGALRECAEAGQDLQDLSRFADLIGESGRRLLETLDGILNLSKLEAGQMEIEAEPIDLVAEVETLSEEMLPRAKEAGVNCQVETDGSSAFAWADKGGVQIALRNLVSNAIKYTEEDGTVWIRTYEDEEEAVVEVEDTGIGMDPDVVEDLFEPFRQASEGVAREYEGTGIGLALTRRIVEEMGGTIDVKTEKGAGSRFTVRLPLGATRLS